MGPAERAKVAHWIEERSVGPSVGAEGWEHMRKLGHAPQVPLLVHSGADPEEREAFKEVARVGRGAQAARPEASTEGVWAQTRYAWI